MTDSPLSNELSAISVALRLCQADFVDETRQAIQEVGGVRAIARHDTPALFDWAVSLLALYDVLQINFAIVRRDVDARERHHGHQGHAGRHEIADLHGLLADDAVERRTDLRVGD